MFSSLQWNFFYRRIKRAFFLVLITICDEKHSQEISRQIDKGYKLYRYAYGENSLFLVFSNGINDFLNTERALKMANVQVDLSQLRSYQKIVRDKKIYELNMNVSEIGPKTLTPDKSSSVNISPQIFMRSQTKISWKTATLQWNLEISIRY